MEWIRAQIKYSNLLSSDWTFSDSRNLQFFLSHCSCWCHDRSIGSATIESRIGWCGAWCIAHLQSHGTWSRLLTFFFWFVFIVRTRMAQRIDAHLCAPYALRVAHGLLAHSVARSHTRTLSHWYLYVFANFDLSNIFPRMQAMAWHRDGMSIAVMNVCRIFRIPAEFISL